MNILQKITNGAVSLVNYLSGDNNAIEIRPARTTPQALQEALQRDMEVADAKMNTAATAVTQAGVLKKELGKRLVQANVVKAEAIKAQKAGDEAKAKKYLAMQLSIEEELKTLNEKFAAANERSKTLVADARKKSQEVEAASLELPRRVLQHEMIGMIERANELEKQATGVLATKPGFKALTEQMDMREAMVSAKSLIEGDETISVDAELDEIMKRNAFEIEWKKLKELAASDSNEGAIDVEALPVANDAMAKAAELLDDPGALPGFTGPLTRSTPEPVVVTSVQDTAPAAAEVEVETEAAEPEAAPEADVAPATEADAEVAAAPEGQEEADKQ